MELWEGYCQHEQLVDFRKEVEKALCQIEEKHRVRILLAADTGSRSCNQHSFGSDLDVHFIFVHLEPRKYLGVHPFKEVIEYSTSFLLPHNPLFADAPLLIEVNTSGWDIKVYTPSPPYCSPSPLPPYPLSLPLSLLT